MPCVGYREDSYPAEVGNDDPMRCWFLFVSHCYQTIGAGLTAEGHRVPHKLDDYGQRKRLENGSMNPPHQPFMAVLRVSHVSSSDLVPTEIQKSQSDRFTSVVICPNECAASISEMAPYFLHNLTIASHGYTTLYHHQHSS